MNTNKIDSPEQHKPKTELTNIRPDKVSVVDYGANDQVFFVAKRAARVDKSLSETDPSSIHNEVEVSDDSASIEEAVWSRAFINDLPDSAFLYIEAGGSKDDENKTTPRSLRHFPYKNKEGDIDLPHLRNAIARIPQSTLSDSLKEKLQNKAKKILEEIKKSAEEVTVMSFCEMIKKAKESNIEFSFDDTITKQVISANTKLAEILSIFNLELTEAKEMNDWDLRWKMGEIIDILVRAAKLEDMLGSEATMATQNNAETSDTTPNTEGVEMSETTETETVTEIQKTEPVEEVEVQKTEGTETESSSEGTVEKKEDFAAIMKALLSESLAPVTKSIEDLASRIDETEKKVSSIRKSALGGGVDDTVDDEKKTTKSIFANIMPKELRSKS
ncbi:hypothetical protein EU522_01460 [Candidatus Thorarchaeota archaeon]|nr:MAG: hypothetical protein EU522_01460 [Candidatus Thorarchaeota archaeon]